MLATLNVHELLARPPSFLPFFPLLHFVGLSSVVVSNLGLSLLTWLAGLYVFHVDISPCLFVVILFVTGIAKTRIFLQRSLYPCNNISHRTFFVETQIHIVDFLSPVGIF